MCFRFCLILGYGVYLTFPMILFCLMARWHQGLGDVKFVKNETEYYLVTWLTKKQYVNHNTV